LEEDCVGQPSRQTAAHFLARYRFRFAGPNIIDPALDFFLPGLLDAFFGGPFVEALHQAINK
jgi:hypothetical protein